MAGFLGAAFGGLAGYPQTVNKAELMALHQLTMATKGKLYNVADSSYVIKGEARPTGWQHNSHHELWADLGEAKQRRQGRIYNIKVKSHTAQEDLNLGLISPWHFFLNHLADVFAGKAAEEQRLHLADSATGDEGCYCLEDSAALHCHPPWSLNQLPLEPGRGELQ